MKKNSIPKILHIVFVLFLLSAQANSYADSFDRETIKHWEATLDKFKEIDSLAEGLGYYDTHLSQIPLDEVLPESMEEAKYSKTRSGCAKVLFNLALASYVAGEPRYRSFLDQAYVAAGILMQSKGDQEMSGGVSGHHFFVRSAVDMGEYELALRVIDRIERLTAEHFADFKAPTQLGGFDPTRNRLTNKIKIDIADRVGDLATMEELLYLEIEEATETGKKLAGFTSKAGMGSLSSKMMAYIHYPRLAAVLARQGKFDEATHYLDEYIAFHEQASQSGANDRAYQIFRKEKTFQSIEKLQLADVSLRLGKPEDAIALVEDSKKLWSESPSGASRARNRAKEGGNAKLDDMEMRLMSEIFEIESMTLWELKRFEELDVAIENYRKTRSQLPDHDPNMVFASGLALWSMIAQGKDDLLASHIDKHSADQIAMVDSIFRFAPERQRISLLQTMDSFSLLVAAERFDLLFPAIVKLKGVVLDSVLEDRRYVGRGDDSVSELSRAKMDRLRRNLAVSISAGDTAEIARQTEELAQLDQVKSEPIESNSTGVSALDVTVEDIQESILEKQAILEFSQYSAMVAPGETAQHYGVAVYRASGDPVWIPLGPSAPIDARTSELSSLMAPPEGTFDDAAVSEVLRTLNDLVLGPALKELTGVETLLISPDAGLGGLSFSVLLDEKMAFACDRWQIGYLSTSRDLLRSPSLPSTSGELVIFADPDFTRENSQESPQSSFAARSAVFDPSFLTELAELPGTRKEMEEITRIVGNDEFKVTAFAGENAQEQVLREWEKSPEILHFATHGMILPPMNSVTTRFSGGEGSVDRVAQGELSVGGSGGGSADNALRRSMLALAGANNTFGEWKAGKAPSPANDGLLSAEEVAGLNLKNTSLAVLSACDTGSGEALSGEGVFGLRRGFLVAGVDHLLVTFWPIADEETVKLMGAFYTNIADKEHPALALQIAQQELLSKWTDELGIGAAVYLAGPFALSTSGPIP